MAWTMKPVKMKAPQQPEGAGAFRRRQAGDGRRHCGGRDRGRAARQHRQVDRQADEEMETGKDQQCAAPADPGFEHAGQRPEDGGGEAADDGQHGDGLARAGAGDLGERDAGGRVEGKGGGHAQRRPAQQVAYKALACRQRGEREGIEQRARGHQAARAGTVHRLADPGREQGADAKHHGDAAVNDLARQPEVALDGAAEHRGHEEGGAPADDLRDAEPGGRPCCRREDHAARDCSG